MQIVEYQLCITFWSEIIIIILFCGNELPQNEYIDKSSVWINILVIAQRFRAHPALYQSKDYNCESDTVRGNNVWL